MDYGKQLKKLQNKKGMFMYELLEGHGVVPVIKFSDKKEVLPLADALAAGGIKIMEITFRSDVAAEAIRMVAEERPDIVVGAGTVTTMEQLEQAHTAGAKFIVSPGLNPEIVQAGLDKGLIMLPGVITPSEVMQGISLGLNVLKYFPASDFNALKVLKSYSAVFADIKFMPTGGVNAENMSEFLALPNIFAIGGSWMVNAKMIQGEMWDEISKLSKEATEIYQQMKK